MQRNLNQHGQRKPGRERERGQILVMFALFLAVLVLFVGLGVDLGFAYITQAQLAKAVDAAALAGMSNYYQGAGTATAIAKNTFTVNFAPNNKQPGYIQGTPTVQTSFSVDQNSNELFTVTALATMKTFFIGLAGLPTLNVSDSSTATRAHVIMTLVLDHSGSMDPGCDLSDADCSQGGTYLPSAVANFISVFEDSIDQAAMVSFGATAVTNVAMETPFKSDITTAANNLIWTGGTFSHGALSNALAINNSVVVPTNINAIKVVVFFTDGMANMIQNSYACTGTTEQAWNFGGFLSGAGYVGFWPASSTANTCAGQECPAYVNPSGDTFTDYLTCGTVGCTVSSLSSVCPDVTTFPSITGVTNTPITSATVVTEAQARCIAVANQMRENGMYVYCVGLTASAAPPNPVFLQEVANYPVLQQTDPGVFNPNLPQGQAVTSGNGADLNQLFEQIAGDILLRLIH